MFVSFLCAWGVLVGEAGGSFGGGELIMRCGVVREGGNVSRCVCDHRVAPTFGCGSCESPGQVVWTPLAGLLVGGLCVGEFGGLAAALRLGRVVDVGWGASARGGAVLLEGCLRFGIAACLVPA